MTGVEVVVLIVGILIVILSFVIPAKKDKLSDEAVKLGKEEIKKIAEDEIEHIKGTVEDTVQETVSYSIEKAERSMERLTNEKIMAVSEYSDTVLGEIHKNHEEVVFLYDMLNDKHKSLKQTVQEADQAASSVEKMKDNLQKQMQEKAEPAVKPAEPVQAEHNENSFQSLKVEKAAKADKAPKTVKADKAEKSDKTESQRVLMASGTITASGSTKQNRNEIILNMHNEGKSNVAIAKELGLGIGEVKLIIDLYKGGKG